MGDNISIQALIKEGILDVCDFLRLDLIDFLKTENRHFGIMKSWMGTLHGTSKYLNSKVPEEHFRIFSRVLGKLRGQIYADYRRLRGRGTSEADCIIIELYKLLEYTDNYTPSDFKYQSQFNVWKKLIGNMFGNIRSKIKNQNFYYLKDLIADMMLTGDLGNKEIDRISFVDIKKTKMETSSEVLLDETKEIEL